MQHRNEPPPGWEATRAVIREHLQTAFHNASQRPPLSGTSLKKYLLVSTPRTGSTALSHALESAGLGSPFEWFNPAYMNEAVSVYGEGQMDIGKYCQLLFAGTCSIDSLVFGAKVHAGQYQQLLARGFDLLSLGFDRVYYVERADKIKQAYSLAKGTKSGFWSKETELRAKFDPSTIAPITATEFTSALAQIVAECEYAAATFPAALSRTFSYEEITGPGLPAVVKSIASDLSVGETFEGVLNTARQSGERDDENLRSILSYLTPDWPAFRTAAARNA